MFHWNRRVVLCGVLVGVAGAGVVVDARTASTIWARDRDRDDVSRKLPAEVLLVQQALRKKLSERPGDPALQLFRERVVGTDVLAYHLPTRMRPVSVDRSGPGLWKLAACAADTGGQVPVVLLLGKTPMARKPTPGGQLFIVATCDPRRRQSPRIAMMLITPRISPLPSS